MDTPPRSEKPLVSAPTFLWGGAPVRAAFRERGKDRRIAWAGVACECGYRSRKRSRNSSVQRLEMPAIARLVLGEESRDLIRRHRPMLKSAFGKYRHIDAKDGSYAARDNFPLQGVEAVV